MEGKAAFEENLLRLSRTLDMRRLITPYVWMVAALGLGLAVLELFHLPQDRLGLLLFALLAGVSELKAVKLFESSRLSHVSVSSVLTIACILAFGLPGGVLAALASGAGTFINLHFVERNKLTPRLSKSIRVGAFNAGMYCMAAFAAGWVYNRLGGVPGDVYPLRNLLPTIGASAVDTLLNLSLLIVVISMQTGRPLLFIWKQNFQWAAPISILADVLGGGALAAIYASFGLLGLTFGFLPVLSITYAFGIYVVNQKGYVEELEQKKKDLEVTNLALERSKQDLQVANRTLEITNTELVETLSSVIDAEDPYTLGHSKQVSVYAVLLGEKLGLQSKDLHSLNVAALLHDIGKVGVRDSVICTPGLLTAEDYNKIKQHPTIGAGILGGMTSYQEVTEIVKHHHERWDGRGYPDGLEGEQIPLLARILAVADAVECMCSDRPYRVTKSFREMKEEVQRCSGTQFDPQVVLALLEIAEQRGPEFFPNSALLVDERIGNRDRSTRFVKKSEIGS